MYTRCAGWAQPGPTFRFLRRRSIVRGTNVILSIPSPCSIPLRWGARFRPDRAGEGSGSGRDRVGPTRCPLSHLRCGAHRRVVLRDCQCLGPLDGSRQPKDMV